ncbi:MAG: thioredoxin family protein [Cytophagales bacterium]|jgi:thiol:disulfide interchange protein|nr:thioredoxin family protein [Cytophagales bacterium]MCA6388698.1 thioredoxin family protein [Cytophagales bacterium]MCA6391981.1 thioredoxin family protein [Cytophagales bacterium]MCA6396022.1 thioredoxin family protein [Cytophagales bacterium]MCA6397474.1 thioredoxin family protein [Cytophagales bacterium]
MSKNWVLALIGAFAFTFSVSAQVLNPAKWSTSTTTESAKIGDELDLIFRATIDNSWYLYSSEFDCEDGPIKTTFTFRPNSSYQLVGELKAIHPIDKHDKIFECDVKIFKGAAEFRQRIKVLAANLKVEGEYEYQVCTEITGQCVPGNGEFVFDKIKVEGKNSEVRTQKLEEVLGSQFPVSGSQTKGIDSVKSATGNQQLATISGPILDSTLIQAETKGQSLWGFFLLAFLAGLAALLTPCVFPMIPMTVSFFTGRGTKLQAVIYGGSIIAIYTVIGAVLAPLMGPETANHLSTEWIPNLIFFLVFIVFGLSFLGLFEITLPGSVINKVDQQAEKGGLLGVFFMAFTLVLVSFSCTGPLVGSILVSSAGGEFIKPIIGMFAFALAFAIPFTLFAFFPGWLKSLPKSGGWLNSVKVVLGFVEIALAFKFLSIADQAFHWRILDRDINLAIWIVIVALIGIYLMKGFRMPGDTGKDAENKTVSVLRVSLAITTFTFLVYLIPGMWGAPLKALAGYLPPQSTHDFDLLSASKNTKTNEICDTPKYDEFLHLPHGINGYFDYKQALACARQQNKPLFIDFTGHGCTNCREMEARVWSDPQVLQRLKNDFVVVALYVDDKTKLPENEWYTSSYDKKVKKTIGKQNADLQITRLNNNAQPFYVLVGNDEKVLVSPKPYDLSAENFVKFLEEGKKRFKANN